MKNPPMSRDLETHPDAKQRWAEAGGAAQPVPAQE